MNEYTVGRLLSPLMGTYLEWQPKYEPPYAEWHIRWCERLENESRKKTTSFSSYSIVANITHLDIGNYDLRKLNRYIYMEKKRCEMSKM